jgi:hypothetical protein
MTRQKLADPHFEVLKYPACSPDLALPDYHLIPDLEEHQKGTKFSTFEYAMSAADWFAAQPSEFNLDGLKKQEQQSKKCC